MGQSYLIATVFIGAGFAAVLWFAVPEAPIVIVLIIAAGVGVLFWLFWFFGDYLPLRRFRPLKERFGFTEGPELLEPLGRFQKEKHPNILTGLWGSHRIQIQYESASRRHPPSLSIHLLHDLASVPVISFHRENLYYRLAKSVGLSRETETDDPIFNANVYVESENDEATGRLLVSSELRSQILSLLSIRRTIVELGPDAVSITIRGHFGWPKYFKPEKVEEILERLAAISGNARVALREVPQPSHQTAAPIFIEGRTFKERAALLRHPARLAIFVASLLFFLGPTLLAWGIRYQTITWRLHLIGLGLTAAALVVYTPLVFSCVRGHSRSHRQFSTFMFAALVGFPTFWIGGFKVINGLWDPGPPFVIEGQVLRRVDKSSRIEAEIVLAGHSGTVAVSVSHERYRSAKRGKTLRILISPGALGEPWVIGSAEERTDR